MFKHFINLQWKSFFRSASFKTEIWFKILMAFGALYFIAVFLGMGFGTYFLIEESGLGDPLRVVNQFAIYYLAFDMVFRYMLQKMPVTNIKPLLYLPLKKSQVVHYSLGKTVVSFFNWSHAFFFIPFSIILLTKGYNFTGVVGWHLGFIALIYCNNFINVLVNNKNTIFISIASLFIVLGVSQYYGWFDITGYTAPFFDLLYDIPVLFSFGQFVPSWDSSYYPLMMSQNIQYREYLDSKWYLMIIATLISTILCSFYIFVAGWEAYLAILVGAVYNIGVNAYLVLWGGAYIKTPIDLTSNKKAFGDKQAFNAKTLLLTIPKLIAPLIIFAVGYYLINPMAGYSLVALSGVLGFVFKNKVFKMIEKIYKKEKYKTLAAYKQKG